MNTKQIKQYEILSEFFASDIFNKAAVEKYFGAMLKLDYTMAEDLWEFMLIRLDSDLKNSAVSSLYVDAIYPMFAAANATRVIKTVTERPVIERGVFRFSANVPSGDLFALPINMLMSSKTDVVDGILKLVAQNEAMKIGFGKYMVTFLDRFFIEMMKKSAQHRVELNRKQSTLLMSTVQKVKGDERAMLIQRVKEVQ